MTLHAFPKLLFIHILYDNSSVFCPRNRSNTSCSYDTESLSLMSNDSPLFITVMFHYKYACTCVLTHVLAQVTLQVAFVFPHAHTRRHTLIILCSYSALSSYLSLISLSYPLESSL
ncbi:hypothetical protein ACTXT7_007430 [Hymenolepis weldensis]